MALTGAELFTTGGGGGASGVFGIADATGTYTYYSTLTLAITAGLPGEVVEMFADVVETGAVTVTLRDGVNINGNGHTYTLDNATSIHALITANTVSTSCDILNLIVVRTGAVGTLPSDNCALNLGINSSGKFNCSGTTFKNTGGGTAIHMQNAQADLNYATAIANSSYGTIFIGSSPNAKLNHCIGYSTTGIGISAWNNGSLQSCIGVSDSGTGIFGTGIHTNCIGISKTGIGYNASGKAYNCIGRSTSGDGFQITNTTDVFNCIGISVSGVGFRQSNMKTNNCTGISSSNKGFYIANGNTYNATSKSTSNASMQTNATTTEVHNSIIHTDWNNALGYGIVGNGGNITRNIFNCTFLLSNASAPYLYAGNIAQAISTRGNTYKGGGAFNVNLTQAIATTEDSQGNIFL
jgi:hypothetical protein